MNPKGIACLAGVLLLWSGAVAAGDTIRRNYHRTFAVEPGAVLMIGHGDGDVTIRSWDRDEIEITVRYHAEHGSIGVGEDDRRFRIVFHHEGNEIEAVERRRRKGFFGLRTVRIHEYVWEINAPADTRLHIDGDDGDIDIENWRGRIDISLDDGDIGLRGARTEETRIELGDGDIDIDDHEGDLDITVDDGDVSIDGLVSPSCILRFEDGDVRISRAEGDFRIDGDDGELRLLDTAARRLRIATGDGDIELRLRPAGSVDWEIETDDGDVDLRLPDGLSAEFTVDVDDGSIRLDLPDGTDIRKRRGRASGTLGDGRGRISISGEDGRISIRADR